MVRMYFYNRIKKFSIKTSIRGSQLEYYNMLKERKGFCLILGCIAQVY